MMHSQSIDGGSGRGADGTLDEACSLRRQLSWSDFDSLEQQMAKRIVRLERHIETLEHQLPIVQSGEQTCLRGGGDDGLVVGGVPHEEESKYYGTVAFSNVEDNAQTPQCELMVSSNNIGRGLRRRVSSQNAAKRLADSPSLDESDQLNMFELPESTFTLLTTEKIMSWGFATGIFSAALSATCLVLAFKNEIDDSKPGNRLGLPWDVQPEVRVAQYLGRSFHVNKFHQN